MCLAGSYKEEIGLAPCSSCDQEAVSGSFSTTSSIAVARNPLELVEAPTSKFNCTCGEEYFLQPLGEEGGGKIGECR
jgi:hypothetical protein